MAEQQSPTPLTPTKATEFIRSQMGPTLRLNWTGHARERLIERNLIMGDVLHVLKNGFVLEDAEESTRPGYFKYRMEGKTPNSGARSVAVIVIPDGANNELKVLTVMWNDER